MCVFAARRSKAIPRTIWMICTQIIMTIMCVLFVYAINNTLFVASALFGICYGVHFCIMIPTISELFSLKHFSIFVNFMSLGNSLSAFLFSSLLVGYIYDNKVAKQQGNVACLGPNCFKITFLVLANVIWYKIHLEHSLKC